MTTLLAILMFSSSVGFSMQIHFCGGEVRDISFYGDVEVCEMMQVQQETISTQSCCETSKKETSDCPNKEISQSSCCHNETLTFLSKGEFEISKFTIEQHYQYASSSIIRFPNFSCFSASGEQINHTFYDPPQMIEDISILHQVFRI